MHAPSAAADTLVSIIIPVFNGARWLADAIDSAIAQTHLNIEVIVVDDGSDDDGRTRAIAESYGDQIRLIKKPNGGVASALNAGIGEMRGSYFSWLSHDDLYHPRKIETQLKRALSFAEPVVVFGDIVVVNETGRKLLELSFGADLNPHDHPLWHVVEGRLSGCALLVPRVCFETCGTFDESLPTTQDYELWHRLALRYHFVHSRGPLTLSRAHQDQGSNNARHLEEASLLWMDFLDRLIADLTPTPATDELEIYARVCRASILSVYPGLRAFARRFLVEARAKAKLTLVADVDFASVAFETLGRLQGAGYFAADAIFIQRGSAKSESGNPFDHVARRVGSMLTVAADASSAEIAGAVANHAHDDAVIAFLPGGGIGSFADLEENLDRLFARESDVILKTGQEANWLDGSVARADVLKEAARRAAPQSDSALRSELEFCARVAVMVPTPVQSEHRNSSAADGASIDNDGVEQDFARHPMDAQADDAASVDGPMPLAATRVHDVYVRQLPPPYLGRFEILRLVRRPFLKPRNVDKLLAVVERLRTLAGGRMYRPAVWATERLLGARGKVDRDWYRNTYGDVDTTVDPVIHYLSNGWREGRDPSPSFSTIQYMRRLAGDGSLNPVSHVSFYVETHRSRPNLGSFFITKLLRYPISNQLLSDRILSALSRRGSILSEWQVGIVEWMFGVRGKIDREWYRRTYLGSSSMEDPSLHYLATGWRSGNKPFAQYRIPAVPGAAGPLAHLNPLSRDSFIGRTEGEFIEEPPLAAENADAALEVALPQDGSGPEIGTSRQDAVITPAVRQPCVALIADGSAASEDWVRYVGRSLGTHDRSIVVRAPDRDKVTISGMGSDVSFELPEQLSAAAEHIRSMGVARFDVVGLGQQPSIEMLLDGLSFPVDVTVLSEPAGEGDRAMLRRAERLLTPDADIALNLHQGRARGRVLHVSAPGEHAAINYRVVRRQLRESDKLRVLVLLPDESDRTMSDVLALASLIVARDLAISLIVAAEPARTSALQSINWVGKAGFSNLVELIGEASPHLLWLATDPDSAIVPYAQHVAEMGLPLLLTGSDRVASRFHGRNFTWKVKARKGNLAQAVARQLMLLRESGLDMPSAGLPKAKGSPIEFYPGRYIEWRT